MHIPNLAYLYCITWCPNDIQILAFSNAIVSEYPQLTNIDGRTDNATLDTLQVSFLKWKHDMIGNIALTEYVST